MPNVSRLLVVDDDKDDRDLIVAAITTVSSGIQYMFATNGQEAINLLLTHAFLPELILLDLNMPIMNGFEFLERRQTNTAIAAIPVIVHTTASDKLTISQSFRLGADGFAVKAETMGLLTDKMDDILHSFLQPPAAGRQIW